MISLTSMEGQEIWTNAFGERFGERVCVGVHYPFCIKAGERFKPTKQETTALWKDYLTQEFGSRQQLNKELEAEFGKEVT